MPHSLSTAVRLPCGVTLKNRVAKPAITEGLADARGWPTEGLERLYRGWAGGGFGLMITGNIIVDGDHLERAGNVIIDRDPSIDQMARLTSWTQAAKSEGAHFWAQLSHSGRQTPKAVNAQPMSPSAIGVDIAGGGFGEPKAMTAQDIKTVIDQFVLAARVCKMTGFTGVQIHAAHGYLISSFLSAKANTRDDQWGGSLENRARFLFSIIGAVRQEVGAKFPISVKLNSADFQKGGMDTSESRWVASKLEAIGVDLLEISGGSYESPAMVGDDELSSVAPAKKASTLAREAYFLDFARDLRQSVKMPIMLTGGLRTREGMAQAMKDGVDVIGIARPACIDLQCVKPFLEGKVDALPMWEEKLRRKTGLFSSNSPFALIRTLTAFSGIYWFYAQLYRHGRGAPVAVNMWPVWAMFEVQGVEKRLLAERMRLKAREVAPAPAFEATPDLVAAE